MYICTYPAVLTLHLSLPRSHIPELLVTALSLLRQIPRGAHQRNKDQLPPSSESDGSGDDVSASSAAVKEAMDRNGIHPDEPTDTMEGNQQTAAVGSNMDEDLARLNFWLHSLPLKGVAKVGKAAGQVLGSQRKDWPLS